MVIAYTGGTVANTSSDGRFYITVGGVDIGLTKGGGTINHTFDIRDKLYDQYAVPLGFEVMVEAFEFTTQLAEVNKTNLLTVLPGSVSLDAGGTVGGLGSRGTQLTVQVINIFILNEKPCGKILLPKGAIFISGPIELGGDVEDVVFPVTIKATFDTSQATVGRQFVEYTTGTGSSDLIVSSVAPVEGATVSSTLQPLVVTFNKEVGLYYRNLANKFVRVYNLGATLPMTMTATWGSAGKTLTLTPSASFTNLATFLIHADNLRDTEGKLLSGDGSTANTPSTKRFIGIT